MKYALASLCGGLAVLSSYLIWGPLLSFLFGLVPSSATYAALLKFGLTVFVAYIGGIGIPFLFVIFAVMLFLSGLCDNAL